MLTLYTYLFTDKIKGICSFHFVNTLRIFFTLAGLQYWHKPVDRKICQFIYNQHTRHYGNRIHNFRKGINVVSRLTRQWLHYRVLHCTDTHFIDCDYFSQVTGNVYVVHTLHRFVWYDKL